MVRVDMMAGMAHAPLKSMKYASPIHPELLHQPIKHEQLYSCTQALLKLQ